jgi:hypothetical protein
MTASPTGMASSRKMAGNRGKTRGSTGPRTASGKARSSRNALRHGLAAARLPTSEPVDGDIERLAAAIAGPNPDSCRLHFARIAAEAELDVRRVRSVRLSLLAARTPVASAASDAEDEAHPSAATLPKLPCLDRYEQRASSRRNRALRLL